MGRAASKVGQAATKAAGKAAESGSSDKKAGVLQKGAKKDPELYVGSYCYIMNNLWALTVCRFCWLSCPALSASQDFTSVLPKIHVRDVLELDIFTDIWLFQVESLPLPPLKLQSVWLKGQCPGRLLASKARMRMSTSSTNTIQAETRIKVLRMPQAPYTVSSFPT